MRLRDAWHMKGCTPFVSGKLCEIPFLGIFGSKPRTHFVAWKFRQLQYKLCEKKAKENQSQKHNWAGPGVSVNLVSRPMQLQLGPVAPIKRKKSILQSFYCPRSIFNPDVQNQESCKLQVSKPFIFHPSPVSKAVCADVRAVFPFFLSLQI